MLFSKINQKTDHEQLLFCQDKASGLQAIIGIHNTRLGPALGGCRMHAYADVKEAIDDVLNLSEAMTYKAAISELALGGGKSVIIGSPDTDKNSKLFYKFGEHVSSLNGRYIVSKDAGINLDDLQQISKTCPYVIGRPKSEGGIGDPSQFTALGLYYGLQAAVKKKLGRDSLEGLKIVVQGAGSIGYHLIQYLVKEKMQVCVSDIRDQALDKLKDLDSHIKILSPDDAIYEDCDILSPCALGSVIDETSVGRLNCSILSGGANNILSSPELAEELKKRDILYMPDFLINSGGLIYVYANLAPRKPESWMLNKIKNIRRISEEILDDSDNTGQNTLECAMKRVNQRIKNKESQFYL